MDNYQNRLSSLTKTINNKADYLKTIYLQFESEFEAAKDNPLDSSIHEKASNTKERLCLNLNHIERMLEQKDRCLTEARTAFPHTDFGPNIRDRKTTIVKIDISRTCATHPDYNL